MGACHSSTLSLLSGTPSSYPDVSEDESRRSRKQQQQLEEKERTRAGMPPSTTENTQKEKEKEKEKEKGARLQPDHKHPPPPPTKQQDADEYKNEDADAPTTIKQVVLVAQKWSPSPKNEEKHEHEHAHEKKQPESGGPTCRSTENEQQHGYQTLVSEALDTFRAYDTPLSKQEKVMVMQGWNQVLAFHTSFAEALSMKWRFLVAQYENDTMCRARAAAAAGAGRSASTSSSPSSCCWKAMGAVERNQDPLAKCMHTRLSELEELVIAVVDGGFRSLCPQQQQVQREAYRPMEENAILLRHKQLQQLQQQQQQQQQAGPPLVPLVPLGLECGETVDDHVRVFTRYGIVPHYWVLFVEAFMWCMSTHVPYAQEEDTEEVDKGEHSAYAKAVVQTVAVRAVAAYATLKEQLHTDLFQHVLPQFWHRQHPGSRTGLGEVFYRGLLTNYPQLLDYFAHTNMDALAVHLVATLNLLVNSIRQFGGADHHHSHSNHTFRKALDYLGQLHKYMGIPSFAFPLFGAQLLDCLHPLFVLEEEHRKKHPQHNPPPNTGSVPVVTAHTLKHAFAFLYSEMMSIVYYPMHQQEKKIHEAHDYYRIVQEELGWSDKKVGDRMRDIEKEIIHTGTYTHTTEELQLGCKLAWRNTSKCIGRIAWNTLVVRDRRHVVAPAEIFQECEEHLKLATAGTNIQSVLTVFQPNSHSHSSHNNIAGTPRFWSSQFVRYAAYPNNTGADSNESEDHNHNNNSPIMGDPANLELTEYLISKKLWVPPNPKTPFDVLPLVLKVPNRKKPLIHQLPEDVISEVRIEHPTIPALATLGYKWTTVPAITNLKINIGGIVYQNMPFNGWFVSTEIVRNLIERYNAGPAVAQVCGINSDTDPMWKEATFCELERAVNYSFQQQGITIVDPTTVGKSFCTHVRREREQHGRECPGQWSWIGGLVGSTNPTWHLEMRDFLVKPQYDYCMDSCVFYKSIEGRKEEENQCNSHDDDDDDDGHSASITSGGKGKTTASRTMNQPRILIAYGSETGNSESIARRLKKILRLLKPMLQSLNEVAAQDTIRAHNISHVLCVCSTFGNGAAPGNASAFFAAARNENNTVVTTNYCILALGSTLYPDFCAAGIKLDTIMQQAGAHRMIPVQKIDAAAGGDGIISEWVDLVKRLLLPPHIEKLIMSQSSSSTGPVLNTIKWIEPPNPKKKNTTNCRKKKNPEPETSSALSSSLCLSNTELLPKGSKSVHEITFQLPSSKNSSYETGDHLCVYPLNMDKMVMRFLRCFQLELVASATKSKDFVRKRKNKMKNGKVCCPEAAIQWQSRHQLFTLVCTDGGGGGSGDEEQQPVDVFYKTPACLYDLIKQQFDLALSAKNIIDVLSILNECLKQFEKKLEPNSTEFEMFSNHSLVTSFHEIASPIFSSSSDQKTSAIDALIAQFPTIVSLLECYQGLFLTTDFAYRQLGRTRKKEQQQQQQQQQPMLKLADILVIMPRLQPRYYSISSSNKISPHRVTITVGILNTLTSKNVPIEGVCSHYLSRLKSGVDRAKISVVKSTFRLPPEKDTTGPMIMVGAGTGLSPLMGFLQEKNFEYNSKKKHDSNTKKPKIHLFFGCRTEEEFIYKDIVEEYDAKNLIDLHLALSRSSKNKKGPKKWYVQDRIMEMGKEISDILYLHQNAYYYVCGDATMAHAAFEACVTSLQTHHAVLSRVQAVAHIRKMQAEGRWQSDVWGIVYSSHFETAKKELEKMKKKSAEIWLSNFAYSGTTTPK